MTDAPQPVQQMDTEIRNPFPVASAQPIFSQLCSDSELPTEDMKLPYNEEVLTVNVLQPSDDREDNEVVDLETIGYSTTDADTHTLAENFNGTGTQEASKPYTICTGLWVFSNGNFLARSGITIW